MELYAKLGEADFFADTLGDSLSEVHLSKQCHVPCHVFLGRSTSTAGTWETTSVLDWLDDLNISLSKSNKPVTYVMARSCVNRIKHTRAQR